MAGAYSQEYEWNHPCVLPAGKAQLIAMWRMAYVMSDPYDNIQYR